MSNAFRRFAGGFGQRRQSGFTLMELSVVLAVIGLIIGAMAIGKDVQRDAEYTKIKNKFIDQWEQAYNQHYQRTGVVVGDDQTAPRLMVNGAKFNDHATNTGPLSGGDMTNVTAPGRICQTSEGIRMSTDKRDQANLTLRDEMTKVGVRMPPGRAEGREDRYVYLDSNGNPQELQVCFQWNQPGKAEGSGNVMILSGLTPDLARMLDQMIDGKADALEGRFRLQNVGDIDKTKTGNVPGIEWNRTNQDSIADVDDGTKAKEKGDELKHDEAQVATVVAIYKMTQ